MIVVIFLFLGNLRSTFIPIVTIPLSLIGVMIALMALGYSINLLTLLALVLGIGLVVDDAIVVVENIHRHIEEGMTPFDAAIRGAHEIALPIIAMTITLAAVYAPIGFVSGVTGVLFREFAFTLAGAVIVSGFIALTLSPMMCSKLLSREKNETWFARKLDSAFLSLRRAYKRRLHSSLNFRALTLLILVGVLALTAVMYASTPRELAPEEDQGILLSLIKTPQIGNLDYTEQATQRLLRRRARDARNRARFHHQRLRRRPQRLRRLSPQTLGSSGARPRSRFSPSSGRNSSACRRRRCRRFRPRRCPARPAARRCNSSFAPPATIRPSRMSRSRCSRRRRKAACSSSRTSTSSSTRRNSSSRSTPTRPIASASTCPMSARRWRRCWAETTSICSAFTAAAIRSFRRRRASSVSIADWLTRYQVRTTNGELVPLSAVATVSENVQPNALTSFQQLNSATLSGVPFPGRTLGEALDFLTAKSKEIFPEGYTYDFQGDSRQYEQEGNALVYVFVFALIVIYLVLAAQYESFRDPLIILIALPTALFGALLPLNIGGIPRLRQHQHLFPDRPRHADRPHLQAWHPDGRFRQSAAGDSRPLAAQRDRGGGRRCGCGPF